MSWGRPRNRSLAEPGFRSSRGAAYPLCHAYGLRALLVDHRFGRRVLHRDRRDAPLMRGWVKEQSLTLFFLAIFALSLVGQSFAGLHEFNAEQAAHNGEPYSYWRFVASSEFGVDVLEN